MTQGCDFCNRPAHEKADEVIDVCCAACAAEARQHTPACDRRVGNRCELAHGYLAWLAH